MQTAAIHNKSPSNSDGIDGAAVLNTGSKILWLFFSFPVGWKQKCWCTDRLSPVLSPAIRMVPKNVYQSGDSHFIYKNINIYIKKTKP